MELIAIGGGADPSQGALRDVDRARTTALLARLGLRVLWLRGARSEHRREQDDRELQIVLSAAQIRDIHGGHNLHIDAPQVVGAVLADFFAQCLHADAAAAPSAPQATRVLRN